MPSSSRVMSSKKAEEQLKKLGPMSIGLMILPIVLYYLLILGYLITLEGKQCNCIRDWRHDFLKYYSVVMILVALLMLLGIFITRNSDNLLLRTVNIILMIAHLINVWCLFTYIGDLDSTECACAIEKQKNMHYFLYIWRYILVFAVIASLISIIIGVFTH